MALSHLLFIMLVGSNRESGKEICISWRNLPLFFSVVFIMMNITNPIIKQMIQGAKDKLDLENDKQLILLQDISFDSKYARLVHNGH